MGWLGYAVLGVAVSIWSLRLVRPSLRRRKATIGKLFGAAVSRSAGSPKAALHKDVDPRPTDDPIDRYYQYAASLENAYKNRGNPDDRKQLLDDGRHLFSDLEEMLPALRKDQGPTPEVLPLKWLVIALEEVGQLEEALSICHKALEWGIEDGTKTGFAGRIKRIERRQQK